MSPWVIQGLIFARCETAGRQKRRSPAICARSCTWAEHPLPAGRTGQGIFVHCVQEHEVHHRGEIYLMLGLMGMEAPDV